MRCLHARLLPCRACLQSHPKEMEIIMRAACTQPPSRPPLQRQQQQQPPEQQPEQQPEDRQQAVAAAAAAAEQQRREDDDEWLKPVVVLVGATMEDFLIEQVVQEVRGNGSGSVPAVGSRIIPVPLLPLLPLWPFVASCLVLGLLPAAFPCVWPTDRSPDPPPTLCIPAWLQGWVVDPVTVRVGSRMRIPAGLQHRCIVVDEATRVAAMCRQIRADLRG